MGLEWAVGGSLTSRARLTQQLQIRRAAIEAERAAEEEWATEVARMQDRLLIRNSKGWFTGYNANLAGREGKPRYQAYFGGAPRYRTRVAAIAEAGYPGFDLR